MVLAVFGTVLKAFEFCWVKFSVLWSLFPGYFLNQILGGIIDSWTTQNKGFRMEGIAKNMFSQKSFFGNSKVDLWCFLEALAGFLNFSALETGLKMECFLRSPWGS